MNEFIPRFRLDEERLVRLDGLVADGASLARCVFVNSEDFVIHARDSAQSSTLDQSGFSCMSQIGVSKTEDTWT